tara:strand:+ start:40870 stop:41430 length:561 start_codon:yes stop_codon:yes gene_type:complete
MSDDQSGFKELFYFATFAVAFAITYIYETALIFNVWALAWLVVSFFKEINIPLPNKSRSSSLVVLTIIVAEISWFYLEFSSAQYIHNIGVLGLVGMLTIIVMYVLVRFLKFESHRGPLSVDSDQDTVAWGVMAVFIFAFSVEEVAGAIQNSQPFNFSDSISICALHACILMVVGNLSMLVYLTPER